MHKHTHKWSRGSKVASAVVGILLAGGSAYAATNWVVGLSSGSSGQAQSATVTNISITAVASPTPGTLLYPAATGDVEAEIKNPNPFPVTVTAVDLPTDTTYAAGYSNSTLTTAQSGCDSSESDVFWNGSTSTSGTAVTLRTPLTVAAASSSGDGTLTVTLTDEARMSSSAPAACENTYFSMPSLTGVAASGGGATAMSSPVNDSWS